MAKQTSKLSELLAEPHEGLDVEIKDWLDLTNNDHKALLAKGIIALANHGGGRIIIGFAETSDGSFKPSQLRPANLDAWSQDAVQSIVAKYVDPSLQCRVEHQTAPASTDRHPIIIVPGGHRVPIRAKSGSPDGKLVAHRVYTRRPGPASEEAQTAEEWNRLFERILQNRRAELLDAMRSIMAGEIPTKLQEEAPSRLAELSEFERAAIERWNDRVQKLPSAASPRFPHGYQDVGMAIDGSFRETSLSELRQTIQTAVRNHSGWPPFLTVNRDPFAPKPIDGAVEFWRGPDSDGSYDVPVHHDFWRISSRGLFFTRMGYREDSLGQRAESHLIPGKYFHLTMPTWRLGEAILEGSYIARALDAADANLIIRCRWTGLAGRELTAQYGNRYLSDRYVSEQNTYASTQTVAVDAIPAALPEVVHTLLAPLYELFEFFKLDKRLVEEELAKLQRNQFAL
jgi:hypothetical protein